MSRAAGTHLGIRELAVLVARAIAVEMVLFEAFGRWITTTSQASAKPLLAAESGRHAWRAGLWRDRYPLIPDADVDEAVAGARADLGALVDVLAVFDASPSGPGRLAAVNVVAAALMREYGAMFAAIDPQLDAPTARLLTVVLADLAAEPTEAGELDDDERAAVDALNDAMLLATLGV